MRYIVLNTDCKQLIMFVSLVSHLLLKLAPQAQAETLWTQTVQKQAVCCKQLSQLCASVVVRFCRLLPQAEAEAPSTDELEEEEGEVAPADSQAAAAAGPWVRKVLRQALQHHPITTLTFCFGCLGTSSRNSSSNSSSGVGPAVVAGVKLWLREHILREASPSRESTPVDCDGSSGGGAASCLLATLAAAAAAGAAAVVNGSQAPKAAAATAGAGGAAQQRSSVLQSVLESSSELRAWVRKEAKGMSRGKAGVLMQTHCMLLDPAAAWPTIAAVSLQRPRL